VISAGDRIDLARSGRTATLVRLIGEGSQGAVFEAVASDGERLAAKWYLPRSGTEGQRGLIVDLVDRGAPDERFLWPIEMISAADRTDGFGYVMPLRPDNYAGLSELLTGKVDVGFSVVCRLSVELADAFLRLHTEGLCYRDISFSNVFFDPATGRPLICDNDNVGVDGRSMTGVLGTRRFMAPEIVRREANPSARTDLYSLAVLLFYVLVMGHPLLGRRELEFDCWDDSAESELFGRAPVFVFDPTDGSNKPSPELHGAVLQYWSLYPGFIQDLFTQAFTSGLRDPVNGRVMESVWRSNLARLRDSIVRCGTCGKEAFVDVGGRPTKCWFCERTIHDTLWLRIGRRQVGLAEGTQICAHHLTGSYDFDTVVGTVVRHPVREDLFGLRNDTTATWAADVDGDEREVESGRSIGLTDGTTIELGATATVVALHQG
jgi:eukaryotic-like serine/threonine-protein kinase